MVVFLDPIPRPVVLSGALRCHSNAAIRCRWEVQGTPTSLAHGNDFQTGGTIETPFFPSRRAVQIDPGTSAVERRRKHLRDDPRWRPGELDATTRIRAYAGSAYPHAPMPVYMVKQATSPNGFIRRALTDPCGAGVLDDAERSDGPVLWSAYIWPFATGWKSHPTRRGFSSGRRGCSAPINGSARARQTHKVVTPGRFARIEPARELRTTDDKGAHSTRRGALPGRQAHFAGRVRAVVTTTEQHVPAGDGSPRKRTKSVEDTRENASGDSLGARLRPWGSRS
jgi:hypothetical protein